MLLPRFGHRTVFSGRDSGDELVIWILVLLWRKIDDMGVGASEAVFCSAAEDESFVVEDGQSVV